MNTKSTTLDLRVRGVYHNPQTESRALGYSEFANWMDSFSEGQSALSGSMVTQDTAMKVSAVYACVQVLAQTVGTLPLFLYQRDNNNKKSKAKEHPLYRTLHDTPNPFQTSVEWREMMMGHLALRGNAYSRILIGKAGTPTLIPLNSGCMESKLIGDQIIYQYKKGTEQTDYRQDQILHIKGLSNDGIVGISPIGMARESIGLAMATEEFGAKWFNNFARPGGVLEHPGKLSDPAKEYLSKSWKKMHAGLNNAHSVAILEEGLKWSQVGMNADDAQFLQTKQYQVTDIARIFRVPPHMIGDLSRSTFSNIEQQSIEFVTHTIRPWLVRWEQSLSKALLSARDIEAGYYIEFQVDGLLRGDITSRYNAYAIGKNNGWFSANDIRELENMNPLPGEQGDIYVVPLNMVPAQTLVQQMNAPAPVAPAVPRSAVDSIEQRSAKNASLKAGASARRNLQKHYHPLFEDGARRIITREVDRLRVGIHKIMATRDNEDLRGFINDFYDGYAANATGVMMPIIMTYGKQIVDAALGEIGKAGEKLNSYDNFTTSYGNAFGARHSEQGRRQMIGYIDRYEELGDEDIDMESMLNTRLDEWEKTRPAAIANRETIQAGGAFARLAWAAFGMGVIWLASSNACPICQELDGVKVGSDENFIPNGDSLQFGEDGESIDYKNGIRHPALHKGCECMIGPG